MTFEPQTVDVWACPECGELLRSHDGSTEANCAGTLDRRHERVGMVRTKAILPPSTREQYEGLRLLIQRAYYGSGLRVEGLSFLERLEALETFDSLILSAFGIEEPEEDGSHERRSADEVPDLGVRGGAES